MFVNAAKCSKDLFFDTSYLWIWIWMWGQADVDGLSAMRSKIQFENRSINAQKTKRQTFWRWEAEISCFDILRCVVAAAISTFESNKMKFDGRLLSIELEMREFHIFWGANRTYFEAIVTEYVDDAVFVWFRYGDVHRLSIQIVPHLLHVDHWCLTRGTHVMTRRKLQIGENS